MLYVVPKTMPSLLRSESRNRALARQFLQRGAPRASSSGLLLLRRCQGGEPSHALSSGLGAASAFGRCGCGLGRAPHRQARPRPPASTRRCWCRCLPTAPRVPRIGLTPVSWRDESLGSGSPALRHVILRFLAFFGSAAGGAILPSRPAH